MDNTPSKKEKASYNVSLWLKDIGAGVLFNAVCPSSKAYNVSGLLADSDSKFEFTTDYLFSYSYKPLQDTRWYMITLICIDKGKLTNITDGKFGNDSSSNVASKIQIGGDGEKAYRNQTFGSFRIDNLHFYNRTLDGAEIKAFYSYEKTHE